MTSKSVMSLAFAAGCVVALGAMAPAHAQTYPAPPPPAAAGPMPPASASAMPPAARYYEPPAQLETNGPQASRGDYGGWSARRNNIESAQYDRLLETSIGFRHARMRRECGPIGDPSLHQQCMASFQQYEPVMYGSSMPPSYRHHWRHYRHAGE